MQTREMNNNESFSVGIAGNLDGTYTTLTPTQSKDFKTYKGAAAWMLKRGFDAQGKRLNQD